MRAFFLSGLVLLVALLSTSLVWGHGGKPSPRTFYIDALQPQIQAVVSSDQGIDLSLDGGETWQWICEDVIGFDVYAFAVAGDPNGERVWLAGSDGLEEEGGEFAPGLYRSTDKGCNWTPATGILAEQWVRHILVNPSNPNEIVVGTTHIDRPNGVAFSTDAGESWQWSDLVELDGIIDQMVRAPSDPQVLYASSRNQMFRSNDGGRTWGVLFEEVAPPAPEMADRFEGFYVNPEDPDDLWFSALILRGATLFRTQDGGVSYEMLEVPEVDFASFSLVDSPEGKVILVGTSWGNLQVSRDLGETWEETTDTYPIDCLVPDPSNSNHVFFCQNLGFLLPDPESTREFFAIGHSQDHLDSIEPYFRYMDRKRLSCPEDSQIYDICVPLEELLDNNGSLDDPDMGMDVDEPGEDMGGNDNADMGGDEDPTKDKKAEDCDCSVGGGKSQSAPWWLLAGVMGLLWRRRSISR